MNLRTLGTLLLLPTATLLTGCAATVYDDRPVGAYGYYEPGYYSRTPRYYSGGYYNRPYVRGDRGDFNRGRPDFDRSRPDFDRGHPAAIRGPAPRPIVENNHHESPHIEAGARPDNDRR